MFYSNILNWTSPFSLKKDYRLDNFERLLVKVNKNLQKILIVSYQL